MKATTCLCLFAGATATFGVVGTAAGTTGNGITADEARALVAEMMADTERRSSLLAPMEPNSTFDIGGGLQLRYFANFRDDGVEDNGFLDEDNTVGATDPEDQDSFDTGFQRGSTEIFVKGEVEEDFEYYIDGDFIGGTFTLEDAYVTYSFDNNWGVKAGQMKVPFLREELVDDFFQLAVDRSIANETFNPGRTTGVALTYEDDQFRGWITLSDGSRAANTGFVSDNADAAFFGGESDFSATARLEYKGAGDWDVFDDFTSMPGSQTAWLVGGAVHYETGDPTGGEEYDGIGWTIDASLEGDGWNAFAAYSGIYREGEPIGNTINDFNGTINATNVDREETTDNFFVIQAGYFLPDTEWELFGRYDIILPDEISINDGPGTTTTGDDEFQAITVGANYYIHGHAAKFTIDAQYAIDAPTNTAPMLANGLGEANTGYENIGYIGDDDEGEWTLRAQFQLMF